MMVRAKPGLNDEQGRLEFLRDQDRPLLVFLHSDAVDAVRDPDSPWMDLKDMDDVDLAVCAAAWARREGDQPPPGVLTSSLIRFWSAQLASWALTDGGDVSGPVRILIDQPQSALGWKEALEVLLAAATLEIPLDVVFSTAAWESMQSRTDTRAAWRQLTDFDLASLRVAGGDGEADPTGREVQL
ncbi:MAG: hypothetical protein AAGJ52_14565 [Pseudomonadota bacterium]